MTDTPPNLQPPAAGGRLVALPFTPVRIAVLTISDTRDEESDTSGKILADRIAEAGHSPVLRDIVPDDVEAIRARVRRWIADGAVDAIITTGGTGLTGRDVTPEALHRLDGKDIPGFGELFRWISFQKICTSTIQSRACAIVARGTYIFALPGSTGAVTETSFNPTAKFEEAFVERKDMAYSYNGGDLYYFMDQETYDMVPLNKDILGDAFRFVTENTVCKVLSYKGSVFGLECPNFMDLEVTETEPGLAGNTATNTLKPATVETGAEVKVPLFINIGDKISIDTRTG